MKRIVLSESVDITFEREYGSISFGVTFGRAPNDCSWIGIRLPFLLIELSWQSPHYHEMDWQ